MGNADSSAFTGFRVLSVLPGSPGTHADLDAYFDFVVEAAGVRLDQNDRTFQDIIAAHLNRTLPLKVYNCMSERTRDVSLTPRTGWGGNGALGITIRFDNFENATSEVVHVLSVEPGSPAAAAGLQAHSDYLLGTADTVFHDEEELAEAFGQSLDQPLDVFVYNAEREKVRRISVTPSFEWGGDGMLGCDIGSGYLHQLPSRLGGGGGNSTDGLSDLASRRVRSPMGKGWVTDVRADGFYVIHLDWELANQGKATLITQEQHLRFLVDETPLPPLPAGTAGGAGAAIDMGVGMRSATPGDAAGGAVAAAPDQIAEAPSDSGTSTTVVVEDVPAAGGAPKMALDLS